MRTRDYRRFKGVLLAGCIGLLAAPAGAQINRHFDFNVDEVLPSAEPDVYYAGPQNEHDVFAVRNGLLQQTLDGFPAYGHSYNFPRLVIDFSGPVAPLPRIDNAYPVRCEVRMRVYTPVDEGGISYHVYDSSHGARVWFKADQVSLSTSTDNVDFTIADPSEFHVYSISSPAGSNQAEFYIDGQLMATITEYAYSDRNGVQFGGGLWETDAMGDADWDYFVLAQSVIFVAADATGDNDGSSWVDAYTDLQSALVAAAAGDEIWVKGGPQGAALTYRPAGVGGSRAASFAIPDGVAVRGGFAGANLFSGERNPSIYLSILSGDLNGDDGPDFTSNGDNSYHVVTAAGVGPTTSLEGFTIQGGNANGGTASNHDIGGGFYLSTGSPTIVDCRFVGNRADAEGGAIWREDTADVWSVSGCTLSGNEAGGSGGAIFVTSDSGTSGANRLTMCRFGSNESSGDGGAIALDEVGATYLTNVTCSGNVALGDGGAVWDYLTDMVVANSLFYENNSADDGGGIWRSSTDSTANDLVIGNSTFYSNSASGRGGGIMVQDADAGDTVAMTNSIAWGNTAAASANVAAEQIDGVSYVVTYSDIEDDDPADATVYSGTGNIDDDPGFALPLAGNFQLLGASPAVDAGNTSAVPADTADLDNDGNVAEPLPIDIEGGVRIHDDPYTADTGVGGPPIVDMGAFERSAISKRLEFNVDGVLPSADPSVYYQGTQAEADVFAVSGGLLHQTLTGYEPYGHSYTMPTNGVEIGNPLRASAPIIFETRVRNASLTADGAMSFHVYDGAYGYRVWFADDGVCVNSETDCVDILLDHGDAERIFHTYRLESPGNSNVLNVYVDGLFRQTVNAPAYPERNGIQWGGGLWENQSMSDGEWDYIAFTQEDCNLDGVINQCDLDCSAQGVSECGSFVGGCGGSGTDWTCANNWSLSTAGYPDDVSGVAAVVATLDGTSDVVLDSDVVVPGIRLLDDARLETTDDGDLTFSSSLGMSVEGGTWNIGEGRQVLDQQTSTGAALGIRDGGAVVVDDSVIDIGGEITIEFGGSYGSPADPGAGNTASLTAQSVTVRHGLGPGDDPGKIELEHDMALTARGSLFLDGTSATPCTPRPGPPTMRGGRTRPVGKITDRASLWIYRDLMLVGSVDFHVDTVVPVMIGGSFENRCKAFACVDLSAATLVFDASLGSMRDRGTECTPQYYELSATDDMRVGSLEDQQYFVNAVTIGADSCVVFRDVFDNNWDPADEEVVYVGTLTVGAGAHVTVDSGRVYYRELLVDETATVDGSGLLVAWTDIPAENPWGIIVLALLILGAGSIITRRRAPAT